MNGDYEEVKGRPKYIINRVTENVRGNVEGAWKREGERKKKYDQF